MAEKEYIELNEAVKACEDYFKDVCVYDVASYEAVDDFERILNSIPVVDVAPVKHGHWEEIRDAYGQLEGWMCKKCGRKMKAKENYCPNCGAKMDKGSEENNNG